MKVTSEAVKAKGLTMLYEPDDPSEVDFDIVFVHGLGGHPTGTWLQTSANTEKSSQDRDATIVTVTPVKPIHTRSTSPKVEKALSIKRKGNTLKKRPPNYQRASPTREKGDPPTQSQLVNPKCRKTPDARGQYYAPVHSELTREAAETGRSIAASPIYTEVELVQESQRAANDTYWPLDFLPDACPNARIFTYGFETHKVQGHLSIGQPNIFARGRELLKAIVDLRRSREVGTEMVFVSHSTGGVIVKEMLRRASHYRGTDNEKFLASIAAVMFMGCPLSEHEHGSMIMATRIMAATTAGVSEDDRTLGRLLGGDKEAHLIYLGCDAFEALQKEYNFRVKVYRETKIDASLQPWAEGLAQRRGASFLDDTWGNDEDIPGDHVNICRFASRQDVGYQSVSSYLARLAHCQALKRRHLPEEEAQIQQALANPRASDAGTERGLPNRERLSAVLSSSDHVVPRWLLQHPEMHTWLRRHIREDQHKILRLTGPPGSGMNELLLSLRAHLARHWAWESHSSVIIAITADEGQPHLDSPILGGTNFGKFHGFDNDHGDKGNGDGEKKYGRGNDKLESDLTTRPKSSVTSAYETPQNTSPTRNTPVRTLRSLLSQLYTHDPRLRNLVCKRTATARTLHNDEVLIETLFPLSHFHDHSKHHNALYHHDLSAATQHAATTTTTSSHATATASHSDHPTESAVNWLPAGKIETRAQEKGGLAKILDDADVWALFWEDYLCLGLPDCQKEKRHLLNGNQASGENFKIGLPGVRRVFILVDAAGVTDDNQLRDLLCWLRQLARRSEFSVCVASTAKMATGSDSSRSAMSPSESTLLIQVPEDDAVQIRHYLDTHLVPDMEERSAIAAKMFDRAAGVMLWVEMVTTIVNEVSEEGVSGEIVLSMIDDIAPGRRGSEGLLDDLYAWKLRRLGVAEQAQALAVMQWVMLVPEPLRLNELLVALRLTVVACRRGRGSDTNSDDSDDGRVWDVSKTLVVEPPISLKELRTTDGEDPGIGSTMMDSPAHFWKWLKQLSQGLLRLESEGSADKTISSEPLGLQRVRPTHESVHRFFMKGKGFRTLLPTPSNDQAYKPLPSTDRFINTSYYTLLHVCLVYLNITELDALGREKPPLNPAPGSALPPVETSKWRAHADAQRRMVMSSYPFLRYVVDHLVFHLLCPREYRYFLPQGALLELFAANRCRIWRRWTHLLGFSIADATPESLLARVEKGPAERLLAPVYGARYRLERVLKRVWRTAVEQQRGGGGASNGTTPRATPRRSHFRSRSDVSEGSMVFMLMSGEEPFKTSWLVPTSPGRSRAVETVPRALTGIEETDDKDILGMGGTREGSSMSV